MFHLRMVDDLHRLFEMAERHCGTRKMDRDQWRCSILFIVTVKGDPRGSWQSWEMGILCSVDLAGNRSAPPQKVGPAPTWRRGICLLNGNS